MAFKEKMNIIVKDKSIKQVNFAFAGRSTSSNKNGENIMKKIIDIMFELLGVGFNSIPMLSKAKGYRTLIGLVLLSVTYAPQVQDHLPPDVALWLRAGLVTFTGLALNSKGRNEGQ